MSKNWMTFDIEALTVGERDAISEIIYDALVEADFRPTDLNWNITVEFYNDLEDE